MEDEKKENETPTNEQVVTETTPESEAPTLSAEEIAELKKKADLAENYKIRAEKAEAKAKAVKETKNEEKNTSLENLPLKDIRALNDVHDDDVEWLINYAKFNNLGVADAKKRDDVQMFLNLKKEQRKTADVTNSRGGNRGTQKPSNDDLIREAQKGNLPLTESEIEELAVARFKKTLGNRRVK